MRYLRGVPCPACGTDLDAASDAEGEGAQPRPGDLSVCVHCSAILVFDEPPAVHRASDVELIELDEDQRRLVFLSLAVARAFQKEHGR